MASPERGIVGRSLYKTMNHGMMRYNQTEKKAENASERESGFNGG
jgi:hypothetical protein